MKKINLATLAATLLCSSFSLAQQRSFDKKDALSFNSLQPQSMIAEKIYVSEELVDFNQWKSKAPEEAYLLNRFPQFNQLQKKKDGKPVLDKTGKPAEHRLSMFISKSKFLVKKSSQALALNKLISLDTIKKIDSSFVDHKTINASQVIAELPDKKEWAYLQNPQGKWCTMQGSLCVQSKFNFSTMYSIPLGMYNSSGLNSRKHDSFIEMQAEVYALNGQQANSGQNASILQKISQINSPIQSMLVQTAFYVSDYFEFAKIITIVQDNPAQPGTSIVTLVYAIALKNDILDKARDFAQKAEAKSGMKFPVQVDDIIMSKSMMNKEVTGSYRKGPEKGLPLYTQELTQVMSQLLDKM